MLRKNRLIWENLYELSEAEVVLLGVPFDGTCTGLPGARLAPSRIREDFDLFVAGHEKGIGDLGDVKLYDAGDVDVVHGSPEDTFDRVVEAVREIRDETKAPIITLGGDHSITLPIVSALAELEKFGYVCYDAHLDLLDDFNGYPNSHTCVNRRVMEVVKDVEIVGARAGSKEEWAVAKKLRPVKGKCYVSIDVDVLSAVPTGTPVPSGMQFRDLWTKISKRKIVAADIMEYNPLVGHSTVPAELLKRLILKTGRT
ncbi:MAG: arginase family protein [Candidatus Diapherotrites archaeon]|nr:arginase family protein [Candidatus Diapherotrites archaeon]